MSPRATKAQMVVAELWKDLQELRPGWGANENHVRMLQDRLDRWAEHAETELRTHVHSSEAEKLRKLSSSPFLASAMESSEKRLAIKIERFSSFVEGLDADLKKRGEIALEPINIPKAQPRPSGHSIFIVHGHDIENRLLLEKMLRERFRLHAVVLSDKPGAGRTIIEKFEAEAESTRFAFILLTPDDLVVKPDTSYTQARPNVLFELGWFYAKIGRANVCIITRAGTQLPTDLSGVSRIDFHRSVEDVTHKIEDELKAAAVF